MAALHVPGAVPDAVDKCLKMPTLQQHPRTALRHIKDVGGAARDVWQSQSMGARYLKLKPFAAGRIRPARHGEPYAYSLHRRRSGWALFRPADEKGKSGSPHYGH